MDYKDTVFLPKTDFSMRANLPQKEPQILQSWYDNDLFSKMDAKNKGNEIFILHDGPPYANGPIHLGTAMNKIIKDMINRTHYMLGKDISFIPGWDCHGLPIEWKIEQDYRKKKKSRHDVPVVEFRKECRDYARKWIEVQKEQFKRLGVWAKWDDPYLTIEPRAESRIHREMSKFLLNGALYQGRRPVMWSVIEQTALAEAEIEYHDHTSPSVYVTFPIHTSNHDALNGAKAVIWTTTAWTLPANRAIAFGSDVDYSVIEVSATSEKLLVATDLLQAVVSACSIEDFKAVATFKGEELTGTVAHHPLNGKGYDFDVPFLAGDHVTTEAGTGLVHTAPAHGLEDFYLGQAHGIEVAQPVQGNGVYDDDLPLFGGHHIFKVTPLILEEIKKAGGLLAHSEIVHSYPHSWRSKAPLIYRTTPQWFLSMETNDLRKKALTEIENTRWFPEKGQKRIRSMIEGRPDWCLSRQRSWGVPLAIFVHKQSGEPLRDADVQERISQAFEDEGADVWFTADKSRFLGDAYNADDYDQVTDVLDVWFDSGCSHAYVLEDRQAEGVKWPADLYMEGSDQHRGWFHTSLLEACGTRGKAPFKSVMTHGYVLDDQGRKMSKSLGNTLDPMDVAKDMGIEILRLWVATSDTSEDLKIAKERLRYQQDTYRRLRNTLRYLLGGLQDFSDDEKVAYEDMPELEQWILHRLHRMDQHMRTCIENLDFQNWFSDLHNFCSVELSSFYFDIRKDVLYCDAADSMKRRAMRTVFDHIFNCLITWVAPVLVFTAEEAWRLRFGPDQSVHLQAFPDLPNSWKNESLDERYQSIRKIRRVMTGALELARAGGKIGSSLQGAVTVYADNDVMPNDVDWEELAITSQVDVLIDTAPVHAFGLEDVDGISVRVDVAQGQKCERCWKVLEEVGSNTHETLCNRCNDVVEGLKISKSA